MAVLILISFTSYVGKTSFFSDKINWKDVFTEKYFGLSYLIT